jgi:hypothetical protein
VAVAEILDRWRIDDEWWRPVVREDGSIGRAEVSRLYFHVALRNRQLLVIFRDLIDGGWYAQTTATPLQQPEPVAVLTPRVPATAVPATAESGTRQAPAPLRRIGVS